MKLQQLVDKYGLKFIIIFGSKAQRVSNKLSDTDVAVYANHILSEIEKIDLVDIKTILPQKKFLF